LRLFECRVLRRIFGPKWEEVEGGWRRLHNEKLHKLYASQNILGSSNQGDEMEGYVARMGEMKNPYKILVRKLRDHSGFLGTCAGLL
jgi:hypothetical protein